MQSAVVLDIVRSTDIGAQGDQWAIVTYTLRFGTRLADTWDEGGSHHHRAAPTLVRSEAEYVRLERVPSALWWQPPEDAPGRNW